MVLAVACYSGALPRLHRHLNHLRHRGRRPTPAWSRVCVAGVSYIQFTSGASAEWTPAGKVKTCSEPGK